MSEKNLMARINRVLHKDGMRLAKLTDAWSRNSFACNYLVLPYPKPSSWRGNTPLRHPVAGGGCDDPREFARALGVQE